MIKKLNIKNFKSIKNIELEFDKFNILCGENASGKTAIIHSILAVVQKYEDFSIGIDGEIIKIGGHGELRNPNVEGNIDISIEDDIGYNKIFSMDKESKIKCYSLEEKNLDINFESDIFYLSSNRIGVVDTYTKGNTRFGINGLASVDFLFKQRQNLMPENYLDKFKEAYNTTTSNTLIGHLIFWHKFITEEIIDIPNSIEYTNQYVLTFKHGEKKHIRSINTGSGFSYLLPIISLCLGALVINENKKKYPTIIIENPEIYLHPKAQDKLTEFLLFISSFAQIIVETHSDHILKPAIEKDNNSKVFVFTFDNKKEETIKTEMLPQNFKTKPISYAEVQYKAFNLITPELHIILYGQLHNKCVKSGKCDITIKSFDEYLDRIISVTALKKTYAYTYKDKKGNVYKGNYSTLPTYIRNIIDHPDGRKYSPEEMKASIDFLLSQL